MEKLRYTPLQDRQIRVLKVLPAAESSHTFNSVALLQNTEAVLHCESICVSLDDNPKFKAISYTWGTDPPNRTVYIDEKWAFVSSNAYDIIQTLRVSGDNGFFWIDTLCINQHDVLEKGKQVHQMHDVYSKAEEVLVWLGPASNDSNLGMEFLPKILPVMHDFASLNRDDREKALYKRTSTSQGSPEWAAIYNLMNRPWFERIWVMQEVALSKNPQLLCGDKKFIWDAFLSVIDAINTYRIEQVLCYESLQAELKEPPSLYTVLNMQNLRLWVQTQPDEVDLEFCLYACARCKATDPRDKVYGLLGMASVANNPAIYPDYTKSTQEVWTHTVGQLVLSRQNLRALYSPGIGYERPTPNLPSWVPDLNASFKGSLLSVWSEKYNASGGLKANVHLKDMDCLALQGIIVDTVSHSGQVLGPNSDSVEWYSNTFSIVMSITESQEGVFDLEFFWRTIIGNNVIDEEASPTDYAAYFKAFHAYASPGQDITCEALALRLAFQSSFCRISADRKLCVTQNRRTALTPPYTLPGDIICVFAGSCVPFAVRLLDTTPNGQQTYALVGECYVYGLMNGEGLELGEIQEIVIK